LTGLISLVGGKTLRLVQEAGRIQIFLVQALLRAVVPPYRWSFILAQTHFLGVRSWLVILLTALFTGMVLAYQGAYTLRLFGGEGLLGSGVALGLIRELAPVLSALMVTGRAGSAMAAELGIMRISEQIDALETLNLEPIKFLISPRIVASVLVAPLLGGIFVVVGIVGAYMVAVHLLGVNAGMFYDGMVQSVDGEDLIMGLVKCLVFGVTIGAVCAYKGFFASRGAEGVGRATTDAVVMSSVLILVWDYVLTSILM